MNRAQIRAAHTNTLRGRLDNLCCMMSYDVAGPGVRRELAKVDRELAYRGHWERECPECGADLESTGGAHATHCYQGMTPEQQAAFDLYWDTLGRRVSTQPCPACGVPPGAKAKEHDVQAHVHARAYCEDCGILYYAGQDHKRRCPEG